MDNLEQDPQPGRFTDAYGRSWLIEITVLEIKMLRAELAINLLGLVERESNLIGRWAQDPILLVDTISLLLTPQIRDRNLSGDEFARGLKGGFLGAANDALIEAIAVFFGDPKGSLIRAAWKKSKAMEQLGAAQAMQALDSDRIDQALVAKIDRGMEAALRKLSD